MRLWQRQAICQYCENEFITDIWHIKAGGGKFCSRNCCTKYIKIHALRKGENSSVYKHGLSDSPEYESWRKMKYRCRFHSKAYRYDRYGGRGIMVCDRWINNFLNFYNDMGKKPGPQYTIDRINNDGDYEPLNCRWATMTIQNNNRSNSKNRR